MLWGSRMTRTKPIDAAIVGYLMRYDSCAVEQLARELAAFPSQDVFGSVGRLSRAGVLSLRRTSRFAIIVSLSHMPQRTAEARQDPRGLMGAI